MFRLQPIATRPDTRFPYTTLFRSRHLDVRRGFADPCHKHRRRIGRCRVCAARIRRCGKSGPRLCGCASKRLKAAEAGGRSEEHTSELQSLMRISYAVFYLKKKHDYTRYVQTHHNKYKYTLKT